MGCLQSLSVQMNDQQSIAHVLVLRDRTWEQISSNERAAARAASGDWQEVTTMIQQHHRSSLFFPQCAPTPHLLFHGGAHSRSKLLPLKALMRTLLPNADKLNHACASRVVRLLPQREGLPSGRHVIMAPPGPQGFCLCILVACPLSCALWGCLVAPMVKPAQAYQLST